MRASASPLVCAAARPRFPPSGPGTSRRGETRTRARASRLRARDRARSLLRFLSLSGRPSRPPPVRRGVGVGRPGCVRGPTPRRRGAELLRTVKPIGQLFRTDRVVTLDCRGKPWGRCAGRRVSSLSAGRPLGRRSERTRPACRGARRVRVGGCRTAATPGREVGRLLRGPNREIPRRRTGRLPTARLLTCIVPSVRFYARTVRIQGSWVIGAVCPSREEPRHEIATRTSRGHPAPDPRV